MAMSGADPDLGVELVATLGTAPLEPSTDMAPAANMAWGRAEVLEGTRGLRIASRSMKGQERPLKKRRVARRERAKKKERKQLTAHYMTKPTE